MDDLDRTILNRLQRGLPICERPFLTVAHELGTSEEILLQRVDRMERGGFLTRFGPLFNAERMGGALTLAAMAVPPERFDEVTEAVNAFPEVAHNYARDHYLNMWFVLATETPQRIREVIGAIETATGCRVHNFPKREEFYVGLHFNA
jgi:DNA-binding Lrp family transcriptional regulator